jgi:predicted acyl esterase
VQVTLTLYPTSNLFMPGHRIRLDVDDLDRQITARSWSGEYKCKGRE